MFTVAQTTPGTSRWKTRVWNLLLLSSNNLSTFLNVHELMNVRKGLGGRISGREGEYLDPLSLVSLRDYILFYTTFIFLSRRAIIRRGSTVTKRPPSLSMRQKCNPLNVISARVILLMRMRDVHISHHFQRETRQHLIACVHTQEELCPVQLLH